MLENQTQMPAEEQHLLETFAPLTPEEQEDLRRIQENDHKLYLILQKDAFPPPM